MPERRQEAPAAGAAEAPNAQNAAADAAQAAGVAEAGDPPLRSREDVRAVIFNRKATLAADAYLAELRADALMRRP